MSGDLKDENLQTITEGKAKAYQPTSVFYNPVQEFNRDLTIAVISEFAKDHIKATEERLEKQLQMKEKLNSKTGTNSAGNNGTNNSMEVDKSRDSPVKTLGEIYRTGDSEAKTLVEIDRTGEIPVKTPGEIEDTRESPMKTSGEIIAGKKHENGVRILEGLAASGLRSIRFGLEIPGVKEIIANDFDPGAVKIIEKNIEANGLQGLVSSSQADAALLMYQNKGLKDRFDVIDLDPYGSAAPFLDSAVQAVQSGGLLCVTCTDASILCGNCGETCYAKYGSMSIRTGYCHEMALRIILKSIESHANRYGRYVVPLLTLSVDFYFRLYLRVYFSPNKVKDSIYNTAMVYSCSGCKSFELQRLGVRHQTKEEGIYKYTPATGPHIAEKCQHCGFKHHIAGPISVAPLHDKSFVERIISSVRENPDRFATSRRIEGMLSMVMEEIDVPLYHVSDDLFNVVHCVPITDMDLRSAILNAGYKVCYSSCKKNSIKTDAPNQVIWDIIRAHVKKNPVSSKRLKDGTPAKAILDQEPAIEVSFDLHPDANPKSRAARLVRFQQNPERDWGPKSRPSKKDKAQTEHEKRQKFQGRRKRKAEDMGK